MVVLLYIENRGRSVKLTPAEKIGVDCQCQIPLSNRHLIRQVPGIKDVQQFGIKSVLYDHKGVLHNHTKWYQL